MLHHFYNYCMGYIYYESKRFHLHMYFVNCFERMKVNTFYHSILMVEYIFVDKVNIIYYNFYNNLANSLLKGYSLMIFVTKCYHFQGTFVNSKHIFIHSSIMKNHNFQKANQSHIDFY